MSSCSPTTLPRSCIRFNGKGRETADASERHIDPHFFGRHRVPCAGPHDRKARECAGDRARSSLVRHSSDRGSSRRLHRRHDRQRHARIVQRDLEGRGELRSCRRQRPRSRRHRDDCHRRSHRPSGCGVSPANANPANDDIALGVAAPPRSSATVRRRSRRAPCARSRRFIFRRASSTLRSARCTASSSPTADAM